MTTFTKHPIVNSGDLYTAANYTTYTKDNLDVFASLGHKIILPINMYVPITGTGATQSTFESTTGTNKPTVYSYYFVDAADNVLEFETPTFDGLSSANIWLDLWGFMDTNNTGTKYVAINIYKRVSDNGDQFVATAYPAGIQSDWLVENTAYDFMQKEIDLSTGTGSAGNCIIIRVERKGTDGVRDTATGSLYLVGARVRFVNP